jgi:uncharacterized protein (DUF58 family)
MSPRLTAYAGVAALALLAALALGRAELVVLAAPFATAAAAAAFVTRRPELHASVDLDRDRVEEGDDLVVTLTLASSTGAPRLDLLLLLEPELRLVDAQNPFALRLRAGQTRTIEIRLCASRWGGYGIGRLRYRARDVLGLQTWEGTLGEAKPLRVYPRAQELRSLLPPLETQVFVGNQVSRVKGEGIEFADIRPFTAGDRVRRINWRASARRDSLWVNEHHPERNSDVILFLDTFAEVRRAGRGTIDLAVRAAGSLAARYLQRKDRVGLVSFGGFLSWLTPASGAVQLYRILDSLLQTDIVLTYAAKGVDVLPPRTLPPKALVLALTPLLDARSAGMLLALRARGFDLVIVEISPLPFVEPGRDPMWRLAYRIWELSRGALRARYAEVGVPVVEWREGESLDAALEEVTSFRQRARHVRG